MSRVRVSTVVNAPPAAVWNVLEDVAGHVRWMDDAVAIRFTSDRRTGVGTTFDCATKVGPFRLTDRMEVTEWQPQRAMSVRHLGRVSGIGRFSLRRATRRRTRLVWTEHITFPLWLGGPVAGLAARPVLRRVWRRNLANLRAIVESDERVGRHP